MHITEKEIKRFSFRNIFSLWKEKQQFSDFLNHWKLIINQKTIVLDRLGK